MTKVIVSEDCGNSPKNLLVEKTSIALARGDSKFLFDRVTDNIQWNVVGRRLIEGKENLTDALEKIRKDKVAEIIIQHVSTHGRAGAVNGTKKLENGKSFAFCDVYEFSGAKGTSIKGITSYVIGLRSD